MFTSAALASDKTKLNKINIPELTALYGKPDYVSDDYLYWFTKDVFIFCIIQHKQKDNNRCFVDKTYDQLVANKKRGWQTDDLIMDIKP